MSETVMERPILFRPEMVRAILDGRKTQTRRIIALKFWLGYSLNEINERSVSDDGFETNYGLRFDWKCPYGKPSDQLWVREPFLLRLNGEQVVYKADHDPVEAAGIGGLYGGWTPSIHMPRKLCRLELEITSVRVERLQEISEWDAIAEGVQPCGHTSFHVDEHTCSFKALWASIHGQESWAANPWLWCISFRRVDAGK